MKIKGLFMCLPLEGLSIDFISSRTNTDESEVKVVLDNLIDEGFITGKKIFRLKKVPKHILNIPK